MTLPTSRMSLALESLVVIVGLDRGGTRMCSAISELKARVERTVSRWC